MSRLSLLDDITKAELQAAIERSLPDHQKKYSEKLVSFLWDLTRVTSSQSEIKSENVLDATLAPLLESLEGQRIRTKATVISFGRENQLGDVRFRDVAGGDIISINFPIASIDVSSGRTETTKTEKKVGCLGIPLISVTEVMVKTVQVLFVAITLVGLFGSLGFVLYTTRPVVETPVPTETIDAETPTFQLDNLRPTIRSDSTQQVVANPTSSLITPTQDITTLIASPTPEIFPQPNVTLQVTGTSESVPTVQPNPGRQTAPTVATLTPLSSPTLTNIPEKTYSVNIQEITQDEYRTLPGCENIAEGLFGRPNNGCVTGPGGIILRITTLNTGASYPLPSDARQAYLNWGDTIRVAVSSVGSNTNVATVGNNQIEIVEGRNYRIDLQEVVNP
jgi:hypothetical protein